MSDSFATPWNKSPTRLLGPWDFPGKNTWSGLPFPSPGDLPNPGNVSMSPALTGGPLTTEPPIEMCAKRARLYRLFTDLPFY